MEIPAEITQNYLRRRVEDLNLLEIALLEKDFKTCEEIAHRLKGSAMTFGFEDLQELATLLEIDASAHNMNSLAEDVDHLKVWVNKYIN